MKKVLLIGLASMFLFSGCALIVGQEETNQYQEKRNEKLKPSEKVFHQVM